MYGLAQLTCLSYMNASRVASEFLEFWLSGNDCGLISGLLVQSHHSPPASLAGHAQGRRSSPWPASYEGLPPINRLYPTCGPTAPPSLHQLGSRTLCGIHSYVLLSQGC